MRIKSFLKHTKQLHTSARIFGVFSHLNSQVNIGRDYSVSNWAFIEILACRPSRCTQYKKSTFCNLPFLNLGSHCHNILSLKQRYLAKACCFLIQASTWYRNCACQSGSPGFGVQRRGGNHTIGFYLGRGASGQVFSALDMSGKFSKGYCGK